jgi:hypothetical protein
VRYDLRYTFVVAVFELDHEECARDAFDNPGSSIAQHYKIAGHWFLPDLFACAIFLRGTQMIQLALGLIVDALYRVLH